MLLKFLCSVVLIILAIQSFVLRLVPLGLKFFLANAPYDPFTHSCTCFNSALVCLRVMGPGAKALPNH